MNKTDCYKCNIEPSVECGECAVWLADEEVSEKERIAYQQGRADREKELSELLNEYSEKLWKKAYDIGYDKGRTDEIIQSIEDVKEQAKEYLDALNALDKAKEEAYQKGKTDTIEDVIKTLAKSEDTILSDKQYYTLIELKGEEQ